MLHVEHISLRILHANGHFHETFFMSIRKFHSALTLGLSPCLALGSTVASLSFSQSSSLASSSFSMLELHTSFFLNALPILSSIHTFCYMANYSVVFFLLVSFNTGIEQESDGAFQENSRNN